MKNNFDNLYEKLGGTYREENGHLIPNVTLPEQTDYHIGKYGRMNLDYIKNHRRGRYTTLLTKTVLVWIVVAIAVGMMIFTLISVSTFDKTERNLFGFKFFIVTSDSMSATDFDAGDIAISQNVDPKTLREGDIITFLSQDPNSFGEVITHKIRRLTTDANGRPGFVTYGTTTDNDDKTVVTHEYVVGQYVGRIPKVGLFFQFLKTTPGYIVCILTPFLLLILSQGLNCVRLFRQYKKEQMEEMKAERAKIEEERAESQRMMAELLELKAQLAKKDGEETPPADPASEDSKTDET